MGGYQIRYLILAAVLLNSTTPLDHLKELKIGILIGAISIIFESILFTTLLTDNSKLTSGNFGVNTLSHILASLAAFIYFTKLAARTKYFFMALLIAACIATGTRSSIFFLLLAIGITAVLTTPNIRKGLIVLYCIPLLAFLLIIFTPQGRSLMIGAESILLHSSSIEQAVRTDASSSMITRLIVWQGTLNMMFDFPLLGVGPGMWSYLKDSYHIPFDALLDPHNDLLSLISAYGFLTASLIVYFIYAKPLFSARNAIKAIPECKPYIAIILTFIFAGLSNAVLWKHQAALLLFTATMIVLNASNRHEQKN